MKALLKITIAIFLSGISWVAKAHQPDISSTLLVERGENEWVLQVRASLTALEYEIERHYGESSYDSPEAFQHLVLDYMKDNVSIVFNESLPITLSNGIVKLGHETIVAFQVVDAPKILKSLEVTNAAFRDIPRNKVALIVLKEGYAKGQFILSEDNQHSITLEVDDMAFEMVMDTKGSRKSMLITVFIIILNLLFIYMAIHSKRNTAIASSLQNA